MTRAVPYDPDALWAKSRLFINRAMDESTEFEEAAFWACCSLELLGKCALAHISPLLIAIPTDDGMSLMVASGAVEDPERTAFIFDHLDAMRRAIADYQSALYNNQTAIENITVTASGMQALALTAQALISQGDRIIYIDPVWPNLPEVFKISGAETQPISLYPHQGRWQLDLDRLLSMLDSQIKAVLINSPNNPTGWVMSEEEQQALLAHCRHHGIWIITDEVYARLCRGKQVAPSFQHIASPDDRIISINSFSKAWSMTG